MSQIMITLQQIKDHDPCRDGWEKVLEANDGKNADFSKPLPASSILESNDLEGTLWVLRCLPEHDNLWRKFAWWCANEVGYLSNDERVNYCLNVVWKHSEGLADDEELDAAKVAAWDTARAAGWDSVWAAAWGTARDAASYAARAAARDAASYAAWDTARDAARDAASYAARAEAKVEAKVEAKSSKTEKLRQILDTGGFTS